MFAKAKHFIVWGVLAAWLASSGLTWDLLQVVAWVNMSRVNATTLTTSEAINKTLKDKPCSLCKVVQKARSASEQVPLDKGDILKAKIKYDFNFDEGTYLILPKEYGFISQRDPRVYFSQRAEEVPLPPPKA